MMTGAGRQRDNEQQASREAHQNVTGPEFHNVPSGCRDKKAGFPPAEESRLDLTGICQALTRLDRVAPYQKKNLIATCTTRWPCLLITVPKSGVLTLPVFGSNPSVRSLPLNDQSGWLRKL